MKNINKKHDKQDIGNTAIKIKIFCIDFDKTIVLLIYFQKIHSVNNDGNEKY